MGWKKNLFVLATAVIFALYLPGILVSKNKQLPKVEDKWWGRGNAIKPDSEGIQKFKINVPDTVLLDLKNRLKSTRLPESIDGTAFHYGIHSEYLKEVISYWKDKYNWRDQEKLLNSFEHFKTQIEGLDIHFIRVKPNKNQGKKKAILLSHGWPGSVFEFYKILPMLSDPSKYGGRDEDALEIVAPSIPGYGYSEAAHKPGLSALDTARIFRKLMLRLGHKEFYVQGGDWGSIISVFMAQLYPDNVVGIHINMILEPLGDMKILLKKLLGVYLPSLMWSADEIPKIYPLSKVFVNVLLEEMGYFHIQSTKPDTVGMELNDSPAGLAAYILEKFSTWTNKTYVGLPDGGLGKHFSMDELLTSVMIYWTTGTITSSMRLYKEFFHNPVIFELDSYPVQVPAGLACFPEELFSSTPESIAAAKFADIVQYSDLLAGGHFAALQEPLLLAKDIWSFITKLENRKTNKS